jgi:arylsulfatase A-like enzyme
VTTSDIRPLRNVLFIMCDQLRWDYLSCYGHPTLDTPHIDALARAGVRFDAAYVQSAVCVPSRMSYYTGRYVTSHGSTWNYVPLSVVQRTLGDYLNDAGLEAVLAGKTHVIPDRLGLERFGVAADSPRGQMYLHGGFLELDRYDGHASPGDESGYARYLRDLGYYSEDPWFDFAIGAIDENGEFANGWLLRNAHLAARVDRKHSETAYMTDCALDFIRGKGDEPWVLHLSYIKPHWPLMAPAPYNAMYRTAETGPIIPVDAETAPPHPVLHAYRSAHEDCLSYAREDVARHVRPTYMGLVKEVDDHIGRLTAELKRLGRLEDTLIIFCSDHGDHLGDHGLGEKELFYEQAVRVPLIVVDPRAAADHTRGSVEKRFVEAVDVLPTILQGLGLPQPDHLLEGRSLLPLLHGKEPESWRDCVFSELDYAFRDARLALRRRPDECYAWMVRTSRWKYVHYQGLRPQLFDMAEDPDEVHDRGSDPSLHHVRAELKDRLSDWLMTRKRRITLDNATVERTTEGWKNLDMQIGVW